MKKRYYCLSDYFKNKYNKKVYKISIDGGFSCPGRCAYCSSNGSLAPYNRFFQKKIDKNLITRFISIEERKKYIENQIIKSLDYFKKKNISDLYIYFQAFSNLFDTNENIYEIYNFTLSLYNFRGLIIGTRPDTINEEKLEILENIINKNNREIDLWIEIGLQTSNDKTLKLINRNSKAKDFENAVNIIKKFKNINIGTHVILGLPYETKEDFINTIKFVNKNQINGIKFHYLYILKDTPIYYFYLKNKFNMLNFDEYIESLALCLGYLDKNTIIFRLFSDPEPGEYLPKYNIPKSKAIKTLDEYLDKHDIFQGKFLI
ncbi:MAG: TIGR01212 family radical SAM protein [Spirochaetes bacterium]|nr:TIGR01212 family radical SAM protein [Spirochaetota bacterium]